MNMFLTVRESCGQTTSDNVALFRNPNYPNVNWEPVNCAFTMVPRQDVCGIRYVDTAHLSERYFQATNSKTLSAKLMPPKSTVHHWALS
jgi:hypothetical protein